MPVQAKYTSIKKEFAKDTEVYNILELEGDKLTAQANSPASKNKTCLFLLPSRP